MLAASIFALTLTASSLAAYSNVNELADTINKEPGTFYTLYAGMPVSDYKKTGMELKVGSKAEIGAMIKADKMFLQGVINWKEPLLQKKY